MYPTSSDGVNKETEDTVYFFTPAFYPLDNFSAHQIKLWGMSFPTVEHAYQWKKFSDSHPEVAVLILSAGSPEAVKRISEAHKSFIPETWLAERTSVMKEILTAKAAQHEDVREVLKKTGKRRLIENSSVDSFWGIGSDGKGQNMVGKIWMEIRENLKLQV